MDLFNNQLIPSLQSPVFVLLRHYLGFCSWCLKMITELCRFRCVTGGQINNLSILKTTALIRLNKVIIMHASGLLWTYSQTGTWLVADHHQDKRSTQAKVCLNPAVRWVYWCIVMEPVWRCEQPRCESHIQQTRRFGSSDREETPTRAKRDAAHIERSVCGSAKVTS